MTAQTELALASVEMDVPWPASAYERLREMMQYRQLEREMASKASRNETAMSLWMGTDERDLVNRVAAEYGVTAHAALGILIPIACEAALGAKEQAELDRAKELLADLKPIISSLTPAERRELRKLIS